MLLLLFDMIENSIIIHSGLLLLSRFSALKNDLTTRLIFLFVPIVIVIVMVALSELK